MKSVPLNARAVPLEIFRVSSASRASVPSGFGTVIEFEHHLQSSTNDRLHAEGGARTDVIGRTLQNQSNRLAEVISQLERRCATLPHPARFRTLAMRHHPPRVKQPTSPVIAAGSLADLVVQHRSLLDRIELMITTRSSASGGEAVLAAVARNHEQMMWRLTTLLDEAPSGPERVAPSEKISLPPSTTESSWENEGGAPRPAKPVGPGASA